jgi:hypothetical protein
MKGRIMALKRFAALLAAAFAVSGLSACARPEPVPAAVSVPAANRLHEVRGEGRALTGAEVSVVHVPEAFRFPPGSKVDDVDDRASGASFTLVEPDPEAAVAFYRLWLPVGFFAVTTDKVEDGTTTLAFTGDDGWAGSIFATANRVAIALRHA